MFNKSASERLALLEKKVTMLEKRAGLIGDMKNRLKERMGLGWGSQERAQEIVNDLNLHLQAYGIELGNPVLLPSNYQSSEEYRNYRGIFRSGNRGRRGKYYYDLKLEKGYTADLVLANSPMFNYGQPYNKQTRQAWMRKVLNNRNFQEIIQDHSAENNDTETWPAPRTYRIDGK